MVGHDLYLLQCPPVCGAGFGYDVATCYFDFSDENLVPVFGAEDDMVAKFIDLVTISLHVHKTYVSVRGMSTAKSKTAQRRESIVNAIPQRTLALSLDITPEQYGIFDGLADSYNCMWGSLVSWCNNNRSINRTRMQKDNYARLRAEYPELPSQFVCIAMRDAAERYKTLDRPKVRVQSTTHNGWGARDNLPLRETRRNQTHVQAATLAVAVVDAERQPSSISSDASMVSLSGVSKIASI